MQKTIIFFGKNENARFRFVTKYNNIDSLLNIEHYRHTEIRFSINTSSVTNLLEFNTKDIPGPECVEH